MNSPVITGATVVGPSARGVVVLLDDGTRRDAAVEGMDPAALRTGQRLEVTLDAEGAVARWPGVAVRVWPRS